LIEWQRVRCLIEWQRVRCLIEWQRVQMEQQQLCLCTPECWQRRCCGCIAALATGTTPTSLLRRESAGRATKRTAAMAQLLLGRPDTGPELKRHATMGQSDKTHFVATSVIQQ
jgi:hypothetical protein